MTVLVTGGTGFIGSHTVVELIRAGHEVCVLDNLCNSDESVLSRVEAITGKRPRFWRADIRDSAALAKIFADTRFDAVIHFAGLKAVGESAVIPLEYYDNNITGSLNLCRAMKNAGCKTLVFSSSATVYGEKNAVPFREDMPTDATNPYGRTKLMLEKIFTDLAASDPEWSVVLLRYFNPIGAHPSGLIGEDPSGIPNNLFPYVMRVAEGKLSCLSVFGNDYPTRDGTGMRDYIHVVDLAKGHLKALDFAAKNKGVIPINLGTGKATSVLELVHAFEKASGVKINYRIAPRRPGDVAESFADASRARELLGWQAENTIDDMCRDGWHFVKTREREH